MNIEALSLDQLRIVLSVADEGSFSAAARKVNRSQSAVSYCIAQSEAQLGVQLFDRSAHKPLLTATGRILVADIRAIVARVDGLRSRAHTVAGGIEPEIIFAVDAVCCPDAIARLLAAFNAEFPTVSVRVHVDALGMVIERVLQSGTGLGVIATLLELPDGVTRYAMPSIGMQAVASSRHPLHRAALAENPAALHDAIQIVLSDRSSRSMGRDYAVCSDRTWRVDDIFLKRSLIQAGVGWGALPNWMIDSDLKNGSLVLLKSPDLPEQDDLTTQTFHSSGHLPGPAMRWIIDKLRAFGLTNPDGSAERPRTRQTPLTIASNSYHVR